jgi:quercetin dioxygenase-like cupin family protein
MLNVRTLGTVTAAAALAAVTVVAQTAKPAPKAEAPKADAAKHAAAAKPAAKHVMVTTNDMKWGPAPDALPAGAQMAVLDGDPSKAGVPFVIRAKLPDGYKVMPHWHPTDESVTVLSGTFTVATGDTWNDSAMTSLKAGEFTKMPKMMHHYAGAKGETVIQIHGMGPFAITYINPKDDPRKKTTH